MSKRAYRDPPDHERCTAAVIMPDSSQARCGRRCREFSKFCWQHARIDDALRACDDALDAPYEPDMLAACAALTKPSSH